MPASWLTPSSIEIHRVLLRRIETGLEALWISKVYLHTIFLPISSSLRSSVSRSSPTTTAPEPATITASSRIRWIASEKFRMKSRLASTGIAWRRRRYSETCSNQTRPSAMQSRGRTHPSVTVLSLSLMLHQTCSRSIKASAATSDSKVSSPQCLQADSSQSISRAARNPL